MIANVMTLLRSIAKGLLEPLTRPVQLVRDLVTAHPKLALAVLLMLIVVGVAAVGGSRVAAFMLIPLSLLWIVVNRPYEGPTLVVLSWSHGITASDLLAVAGLGIAAWRLGQAAVAVLR